MKQIIKYSLISFVLIIANAQADVSPIGVDSFTGVTFGQPSRSTFSANPSVLNYSEDIVVMTNVAGLVNVGAGGSFRLVNHMNTVTTSVGNFRGTRWEIVPAIGADFMGLGFVLEPIIALGRYNLSTTTASNTNVSYKSPLGARLFLTWDQGGLGPLAKWGISFMADYTTYGTQNDSTSGDTTLTNKLKVWSVGFALHLGVL